MAVTWTNRAWRVGGFVAASILCWVVAVGVARWPDIQFELGYAYENGNFHGWTPGFAQDYGQAARWLSRASQANHPRAQYRLGILHAHG
jgi:TPR repeat protein